jgi:hypothetical protein
MLEWWVVAQMHHTAQLALWCISPGAAAAVVGLTLGAINDGNYYRDVVGSCKDIDSPSYSLTSSCIHSCYLLGGMELAETNVCMSEGLGFRFSWVLVAPE